MKIITTAKGFIYGTLQDIGKILEIPDEPKRKVTESDHPLTKSIADKKGLVPVGFAANWMAPAPKEAKVEVEPAQQTKAPADSNDSPI